MGLLVVQVLDAVLDLAQKAIGCAERFHRRAGHQAGTAQARQGVQRGTRAQLGELPTAHHLQQLHGEFDFPNTAP